MSPQTSSQLRFDRRSLLAASGVGFCGLDLRSIVAAPQADSAPKRHAAKSTILIFLQGGASHIDTWDLKPEAPAEYRGEFQPIETSAPGVMLCEHLPLTARQAHHMAVVNSVGDDGKSTAAHHGGHYHHLTGHPPDATFFSQAGNRKPDRHDWPYIGSVVSAKRPPHPYLPSNVWMPQQAVESGYVRPGQFAGRLGGQYDPVYVNGRLDNPLDFRVPSLTLDANVTPSRLESRKVLLRALDGSQRHLEQAGGVNQYTVQQQMAVRLLSSQQTKTAFRILNEPESVREKYGPTINSMSLLMARRLVEAEVPFITVWWSDDRKTHDKLKCKSAGNWDTHGNNFFCLKNRLLPDFDRAYAALLDDLHQRGLLNDTLVVVTSEMGRQPKIGDPRSGGVGGAGRDHWLPCLSVLLAGGGIRGGRTYGSSDKRAEYPADKPVGPEHIAHTIYHAMGIEDLSAVTADGKRFQLMEDGFPLVELF